MRRKRDVSVLRNDASTSEFYRLTHLNISWTTSEEVYDRLLPTADVTHELTKQRLPERQTDTVNVVVVKKMKLKPLSLFESDRSHADLFSGRRGSARGQTQAVYLRLRSLKEEEEEACTTQEILDRHAGKMLRRTAEQRRRKKRRRLERKDDGREQRRTGTG